jgi:tRNA dimethylallyltransferase
MAHKKQIAVLMGPTGSGKSALALSVAKAVPAVIINADAMQMVAALRILSARPTEEEERQAEHALYGVLQPEEPTSVARWLALVEPIIRRAWDEGKLPLLVGGTGMYVKGLMEGIARIPPVPEALREELRACSDQEVRRLLEAEDPAMAAAIKPGDSQRNLRALEVFRASGRSLGWWQSQGNHPLFPEAEYYRFYADMPRELVYGRIDRRFETMMEAGALDEVRALMALGIPAGIPIMRAHGVPELIQYLRGEMTREQAIAKAQQNTRNYAKRQLTWIRNQMPEASGITGAKQLLSGLN